MFRTVEIKATGVTRQKIFEEGLLGVEAFSGVPVMRLSEHYCSTVILKIQLEYHHQIG